MKPFKQHFIPGGSRNEFSWTLLRNKKAALKRERNGQHNAKKRISNLPFHDTPEQAKQLEEVIEKLKGQQGAVDARPASGTGDLRLSANGGPEEDCGRSGCLVGRGIRRLHFLFSVLPDAKGKNHISVCLGTACYVKGADKILEKITQRLGNSAGGVHRGRSLSLTACRCIGACGLAPVMTINEDVYGRLVPEDIDQILAKYTA